MTSSSTPVPAVLGMDDGALADRLHQAGGQVAAELRKVIVGQDDVIELALIGLMAGGNCLLVGVPGLAKTLLIQSLARALDLNFSRIQFTPDLMPSDVTGSELIQIDEVTGRREMKFLPGPIFGNVILADEINRTPPKTQSALLEAMQEHRVTVQGRTYRLEEPFYVFATQNPIELEGTYPLPEAQLDRFLFEISLDHLGEDDEVSVVTSTTAAPPEEIRPVLSRDELLAFQALVRRVPVADEVVRHAVHIVRASRPGPQAAEYVGKYLAYGASVRAAQAMVLAGKARALLHGRFHVDFEDVRALARPGLRHRLLRTFQAQSDRVTTDALVERLLAQVSPPRSGL